MANYRVTLSFPYDTQLPRDRVTITPCFNGSDPQALGVALSTNLDNWAATAGKPCFIRIYDADKAPPSYPLWQTDKPGTVPSSACPREVSLCISFYSTYNRPSYRGRLYLPAGWLTSNPPLKPTNATMTNALTFASEVLRKSLPAQTNWAVYSKLHRQSYTITDAWVDNEWDTQRKRGLRADDRVSVHY